MSATPPPPTLPWFDYDYAVVRLVPRVYLGTFHNVGVVMHARTAGFLEARLHIDRDRLAACCPTLDVDVSTRYLNAYQRICQGARGAGPIALLPPSERFLWLTMTRSAVLQTSHVHAGRTHNLHHTLERLFQQHVDGA